MVLRTFLWKFRRIFTNFVDIFSGFSAELVKRSSLELVSRNSLDRVMRISWEWVTRNYSDLVPRNGLREIPRKAVDIFTLFSCERFLGISADFPQNCYMSLFNPHSMQFCYFYYVYYTVSTVKCTLPSSVHASVHLFWGGGEQKSVERQSSCTKHSKFCNI